MTCMLNRFSRMQLCVTSWTVAQPGFSVHEILWARILEWVAISFSRGSSLTQGSNLSLLYLLHWQAGSLPHLNGNPRQRQSLKKMQRNWSCFLSWSYFLFIPFLLYFSLPFPLSFPNSIPNCFFSFPGFWFPLGGYNLISPVWTCFCVLSPSVWLFATSRTASRQAPLSWGFSRQECWSGLPCSPPGYLPNPWIKLTSPALQVNSLLAEPSRKSSLLNLRLNKS